MLIFFSPSRPGRVFLTFALGPFGATVSKLRDSRHYLVGTIIVSTFVFACMRHILQYEHLFLAGLQRGRSMSPVQAKGHVGQVLAITYVAPFNLLVTSGEKDRMIRRDVFLEFGIYSGPLHGVL